MVFTTSGRSPFLQSKRSICDAFWLLARRCNVTTSHRYHRVNRTSSHGGKTWVFSGRMLTSRHEGLNRCIFTKYPSFKFALQIPGVVCNGSMPLQIYVLYVLLNVLLHHWTVSVSVLLLLCYHFLPRECDVNIQSHIKISLNSSGFPITAGYPEY